MKMKQLALVALITSSLSLMGCEDSNNASNQASETKAAESAPVAVETKPAETKATFDAAKVADNAQARYEGLSKTSQALYDVMLSHAKPMITLDIKSSDYARQEQGATAKSALNLKFDGKSLDLDKDINISLTSHDTISYNEALWNEGVEARVESKLEFSDALLKSLEINPEEAPAAVEVLKQLESKSFARTDFLKDKQVRSVVEVGSVEIKAPDGSKEFIFKGLNTESNFNEEQILALLGAGEYRYDFKGIEVKEDAQALLDFKPFNLQYTLSPAGDLVLKGSALEIDVPKEDGKIKINEVVGDGKVSAYDTNIASYLGNSNLSFKDIEIKAPDFNGQAYNFGSLHLNSHSALNDQAYTISFKLAFDINDKTIKALVPDAPANVEWKQVSFEMEGSRWSADLMKLVNQAQQIQQKLEENPEEAQAFLADALELVFRDQSNFKLKASLETSLGAVKLDSLLTPVANVQFDKAKFLEELKSGAFDEKTAGQWFELDALVTADAKLLDETGASMMLMMMGGELIEQKDGQYRAHFLFKNNEATVNGKPLPH
ncbi:MAG: DUF945 family protein [Cardiobacteriaceae bacterium]|nr:DUF945 family protein [Cardiobacteriaceae bacterium]